MSDSAIRRKAQQWLAQARPAMVVEVMAAQGSVPREAGTRMLVDSMGAVGTIGGGHLEWLAVQRARQALAAGVQGPIVQRQALGPALGQCCGGVVDLRMERLSEASLQHWPDVEPMFRLCLYGAGHVGHAIARLLRDIDCEVDWVDVRDDAFTQAEGGTERCPPHIRQCVSDSPVAEAKASAAGSHHLVMTHSHALDFDVVDALLRRHDTGRVGLIGSRTKRMRFEHRLLARGHEPNRVAQLICPIGLEGIDGKSPPVIAVAVVAQLLTWTRPRTVLVRHKPRIDDSRTTP